MAARTAAAGGVHASGERRVGIVRMFHRICPGTRRRRRAGLRGRLPTHAHRRFMALIERGHHLRASAGVTPLARATADAARRSAVGRPWLRPGVDRGRVREPIDGCAYVPSGAGTLVGQRPDLVARLIARQGGPTKDEQPSLARPDKPLPRPLPGLTASRRRPWRTLMRTVPGGG